MKKRSVAAVILLPIITIGIYALYWFVKTKGELNEKGASIPTAWLLIIPLVNIWWIWKYFDGVDHVTNGKVNGVLMFVLDLFVTALIPMAICQDAYNKMSIEGAVVADNPVAPVEATEAVVDSAVPASPESQAEPMAENSQQETTTPSTDRPSESQNPVAEGENNPPLNPVV